jgi:hypothetical protein
MEGLSHRRRRFLMVMVGRFSSRSSHHSRRASTEGAKGPERGHKWVSSKSGAALLVGKA